MNRKIVALSLVATLATLVASPAFASDEDDGPQISDGTCPIPAENEGLSDFGHDLGNIFKKIGHSVVDGPAALVGVIELTGVRYPIGHPYQEEVSPTLWRGSRLDDAKMADLAARGFKATVDLTKEGAGDAKLAPKYGLNTMNVPTLDNWHPSEEQMIDFLDYVTAPENQPVYIHCEAGVGRTSIATAVYRMAVEGWSVDAALAEAKKHGMGLPNQQEFVKKFGSDLAAGKFTAAGFPPTRAAE